MTSLEAFEPQEEFTPQPQGGAHGQCISRTKSTGERCRAFAMSERGLCNNHDPENYDRMQAARRAGGAATRKMGVVEKQNAFVAERFDELMNVLLDATKADKAIGFEGDTVPDHAVRVAAVREIFDRGIGKAVQASKVEHSGLLSLAQLAEIAESEGE